MKHILICLTLIAVLLSACAPAPTPVPATEVAATQAPATEAPATEVPASPLPPTQAAAGLFQIVRTDGTTFDVMLDAVKALTLVQITVEGKVQEGPRLLDVLALAGITDFSEVTIEGSSAPCTLTRAQVDDNTILDFSNRGTMKLATTYIPKADWTKDITKITVT
jgi:hypothetical protein